VINRPDHENESIRVDMMVQVEIGQYTVSGQEKIISFLGAQAGDKNFLQTNGVFLC
jgi:hypothetical protein